MGELPQYGQSTMRPPGSKSLLELIALFSDAAHAAVVPATQMVDYVLKGHDFSRAENGRK